MSKIQDFIRKGADLIDLAVSCLDVLSRLTKNVKDDRAVEVVKLVSSIVEAARNGFSGKVKPADALKILDQFKKSLQDSDLAALNALKKKFGIK